MATKFDPYEGINYIPYERPVVDFIDKLLDVAKTNGSKDDIKTSYDWKTLEFLYKGWSILYPVSARDFEKHMKRVRTDTRNNGVVHEGSAMLQSLVEIPQPLYRMIRIIFPKQKWDRKFIDRFVTYFPQMSSK